MGFFKKPRAKTKKLALEKEKEQIVRRMDQLLNDHKLRSNRLVTGAADLVGEEFGKSSDAVEKVFQRGKDDLREREIRATQFNLSSLYVKLVTTLRDLE